MTEHRWSKFWWADYEGDDALRLCSLAAQGLWMRMLCVMHRADPHGHLAVNGAAPTPRQLAIMLCATEREIGKLVPELEAAGVFSRTANGLIFCRRLLRDKALRDEAIQNGKRGGNPALRNVGKEGGLTPSHNATLEPTLKLEAEAEAEAEADILPPVCPPSAAPRAASPPRAGRGSRLPPDWAPSDADIAYADKHGVDWQRAAERFRNYWVAKAGKGGVMLDWAATWRNWVLKDAEQPKPKLHTLPREQQDRRILAAVGLGFNDPPPIVQPMRRIAQ